MKPAWSIFSFPPSLVLLCLPPPTSYTHPASIRTMTLTSSLCVCHCLSTGIKACCFARTVTSQDYRLANCRSLGSRDDSCCLTVKSPPQSEGCWWALLEGVGEVPMVRGGDSAEWAHRSSARVHVHRHQLRQQTLPFSSNGPESLRWECSDSVDNMWLQWLWLAFLHSSSFCCITAPFSVSTPRLNVFC